MAWEIKDEWIDLAQAHHTVVFHNPDVLVDYGNGKPEPVQHHLKHEFKLNACSHCGHPKVDEDGEPVDFHQVKADVHESLKAHHSQMMQHREKHPRVRIGSGPKA